MLFFVYDVRFLNCAFLFNFWFRGKKARVAHSMCRKKFILFLNLHSVLSCHTIFGTVFIPFLTPYSHAAIFLFPFHVKTCVKKKPSHQFVWQNVQLKGLLNWKTDDSFKWNVWDLAARIIFVNIFSRRKKEPSHHSWVFCESHQCHCRFGVIRNICKIKYNWLYRYSVLTGAFTHLCKILVHLI